jgi:hypothetical protein
MSSVLILSKPIAKAFSFPSAMIATTDSFGKSDSILAPFDVNPGHMILAPESTNLIAPRSTWIFGKREGSIHESSISFVEAWLGFHYGFLHLCKSFKVG